MGKKFTVEPPSDWEYVHPSQDGTGRFATDKLIRDYGYTICERKKGKQPVWIKSGKQYDQSEILLDIDPKKIEEAIEEEITYFS